MVDLSTGQVSMLLRSRLPWRPRTQRLAQRRDPRQRQMPGASSTAAPCEYVIDPDDRGTMPPGPTGPDTLLRASRRPIEDGANESSAAPQHPGGRASTTTGGQDTSRTRRAWAASDRICGTCRRQPAYPGRGRRRERSARGGQPGLDSKPSGAAGDEHHLHHPHLAHWQLVLDGSSPGPAFALPGGGFVETVQSGPATSNGSPVPTAQIIVSVQPDGSTGTITAIPQGTASLVGVVW